MYIELSTEEWMTTGRTSEKTPYPAAFSSQSPSPTYAGKNTTLCNYEILL